jgi:hypothetical protein
MWNTSNSTLLLQPSSPDSLLFINIYEHTWSLLPPLCNHLYMCIWMWTVNAVKTKMFQISHNYTSSQWNTNTKITTTTSKESFFYHHIKYSSFIQQKAYMQYPMAPAVICSEKGTVCYLSVPIYNFWHTYNICLCKCNWKTKALNHEKNNLKMLISKFV